MSSDNNETNIFRLSVSEWRGGVTEALDNIREDIKEMKKELKEMNSAVMNLKIRVSIISGSIAFIGTCLINFVIKWLTK